MHYGYALYYTTFFSLKLKTAFFICFSMMGQMFQEMLKASNYHSSQAQEYQNNPLREHLEILLPGVSPFWFK